MNQNITKYPHENNMLLPIDHPRRVRHWKLRVLKDKFAHFCVTLGGNSVIVAILLIFFYLVYETAPLLKSAEIEVMAEYPIASKNPVTPGKTQTEVNVESYYTIEEQGEIAAKFERSGRILFFDTRTGEITKETQLIVPQGAHITSFYAADPASGLVAYGLSNGHLLIARHEFKVSFPDDKRLITPEIVFPMGKAPLKIDSSAQALKQIAVERNEEKLTIVALTEDKRLLLSRFIKQDSKTHAEYFSGDEASIPNSEVSFAEGEASFFTEGEASFPGGEASFPGGEASFAEGEASFERIDSQIPLAGSLSSGTVRQILLNKDQNQLFVVYQDEAGRSLLDFFSIGFKSPPELIQQLVLAEPSDPVTIVSYLTGGISILVGQQSGRISQWFPVRIDGEGEQLKLIREFNAQQAPIIRILSEMQRKGFVAIDEQGFLGIYHTTAEKTLLLQQISPNSISQVAIAPRANYLLTVNEQADAAFWAVDNEHPEISWHSMWDKVWYESYPKAEYIWQSSSASNDFEPKFSLTPLAFGTLKAAFYAMLFAIPLAIMGAIYTAYFMTPRVRGFVKPSIEIMEALPTVILGFLAGLWLAPLIEDNLPAVFSLLFVLPLSVLLTAWGWHSLPARIHQYVSDGWEAFILMPVLILVTWGTFTLSLPMEALFFDGDMQSWLDNELGLGFNQRNSIVIGIAMGFAVIPTIFSITEDAVFSVPKHLTLGSLALGATRWQTLIRVVILTASPAIFSAVMIGFGRAIGETMIVLMATGNTPVMDFSIFQGMRTLSANIAVEIPESEVASSHYRVLFLAALVLFIFTFMFNTIAELIRQNLRKKYSNL